MKYGFFWYMCFLVVLNSCTVENQRKQWEGLKGYGISYDPVELSHRYENRLIYDSTPAEMIKLELNSNSIIDQLAKLEVLDDYFIVLTQGRNKDVLIFDSRNGNFVYSFKSSNPHLLVNPTDFSLYKDKIYINDYDLMHLLVFDISNLESVQFLDVTKSELRFDKFSVVDENHILVYPYMASLNSWNGEYLNFDLLLLNSELELLDKFLPYNIEKYHYGSNYGSTNNINFISPFYKLSGQSIYFSDLLSDTTYQFYCSSKEIEPFLFHENNEVARKIALETDLAVSISLMEESGKDFGAQIMYMDDHTLIFTSVAGKKIATIMCNLDTSKYTILSCIDYSAKMSLKHFPRGLPILKIDQDRHIYAVLMPYLYSEVDLKKEGFEMADNPAIVKYAMSY